MKPFSIMALLVCFVLPCLANSVRIKLFNNSNSTITGKDFKIHNGDFLIKDHGNPVYNKTFVPGTVAEAYTGTADVFCGTDGYIEFQATVDNRTYQFVINFNNPYIGTNQFHGSASFPFSIRHLSGGDGSDVMISYELTGGPSLTPAAPPTPPIELPVTGSKVISGRFFWNSDTTGMPQELDMNQVFDFQILAPSILKQNPSASANYQGQKGTFENVKELKGITISYTDSRDETRSDRIGNVLSPKRSVKYVIGNLPEGIPLIITARPASPGWDPGKDVGEKPPGISRSARWCVFLQELPQGDTRIDYEVLAGWFDGSGNYEGGPKKNGKQPLVADLKRFRPQTDFGIAPNEMRNIERTRQLEINADRLPAGTQKFKRINSVNRPKTNQIVR